MSGIDSVFHGINIACGALNTLRSTGKLFSDNDIPLSLRIADVAVQCFGVGCDIYEVDLLLHHAHATQLLQLKNVEILDKVIAIPIRCSAECIRALKTEKLDFGTLIKCLERGVLSPLTDFVRVGNELDVYDEKQYLEMTPEELAKHPRPIYKNVGDADSPIIVIDHYEPRTKENCQAYIDQFTHNANCASGMKCALDAGVLRISMKTAYYALITLLQQNAAPQTGPTLSPTATASNTNVLNIEQEEENPLDLIDSIDLIHQKSIPSILATIDPFFQDYLCSISHTPMKDPVQDPTGGSHLYDKVWILWALRRERKSPITRLPLQPHQLIPRPDLKALINTRLRMHQERIQQIMEQQPELFLPQTASSSSATV